MTSVTGPATINYPVTSVIAITSLQV